MARLVMKFGGTSVADLERIGNVARHVRREVNAGNEVAVVVSARAGETNALVALCRSASVLHDAREYDAVVSSGEQVTAGLLAIVLQNMGVNARSWFGWQIPVRTDAAHGAARITDIRSDVLVERLAQGQVAVVAGFQGVSSGESRHHARARRLRYQRRRHRRRHRRGALRHLYRCRRRLYDRPAHRAERPPARPGGLRGNARNGFARLEGAAGALRRARHGAWGAHLRALLI